MTKVDYLIVSYATLPLARPRSYQIAKLLRNLDRSFFIITSDYSGKPNLDFSLSGYFPCEGKNILRVKNKSDTAFMRMLFEVFPPLKQSPDNHWLWARSVIAETRRLSKVIAPSAIIAFSRPETDLLIGVKLKKIFGVPLVVHFSDPWVDNPYARYTSLTRKINSALEARVINAADLILFTNEDQKELVMGKYPEAFRRKARSMVHCYDENLYTPVSSGAERFTIRHIGNLYKQRTPQSFLEAIRLLIKHHPEVENEVLVEFYGQISDEAQKAIHESSLSHIVKVKPSVPYAESLSLMSGADLLVVIDAESNHNTFFPSKLVDYMGSGKNILGMTAATGPTERIIKAYGGHVFQHDQLGDIKDFLLKSIEDPRPFQPDCDERRKYNAKVVAGWFERAIESVMAPK